MNTYTCSYIRHSNMPTF